MWPIFLLFVWAIGMFIATNLTDWADRKRQDDDS